MSLADAYDHDQRYALCGACGAPVAVPLHGGRTACAHCRAPVEVRMRMAAALEAPRRPEAERIALLAAQDPRFVPPFALAPFFAAERIAPAREQEAWARWRALGPAAASAPEAAEELFVLTLGLAENLFMRGEHLAQRALIESALSMTPWPRHRQVLCALLSRSACRAGDASAAQAWLAECDPRSEDLLADTAYRLARATLDTAAGRWSAVVHGLGASAPVSHAYAAEHAVLCANAWEQHGQLDVAVGQLLDLEREHGPLAARRARRFIAAHQGWCLCASSAPRAEALASALVARIYDPSPAGILVTVMAAHNLVFTSVACAGTGLAIGSDVGVGGFLLSILTGAILTTLFGALAVRGWLRVRARRALRTRGRQETAHVLASSACPDPMFGTEGVYEVSLDLLVTPDDAPAYRAPAKLSVMEEALGPFRAGGSVIVRADPKDSMRLAVDPSLTVALTWIREFRHDVGTLCPHLPERPCA